MRPSTFSLLVALVAERTGIVIHPDKQYLLETRLRPVVQDYGLESIDALARALVTQPDPTLIEHIADAMTTNETSFFRDARPFELLGDQVIPGIVHARRAKRRLSIWSAACSSGQEIYSISMLLAERFPQLSSWTIELLATDVSPTMVERCEEATYSRQEVSRGLSAQRIERHFFEASPNEFLLDPSLKRGVSARVHNLLEPLSGAGPFDLVVLRNVLIYFDASVRRSVLSRIHEKLAPDGILMLGTAESADEDLFNRADRHHSGFFRPIPRTGDGLRGTG